MRRALAALLALALAACGGGAAETASGETTGPARDAPPASGGEGEGNQQSSAHVTPEAPAGAEWRECAPRRAEGMGLWIPIPAGGDMILEDEACIVAPLGASDPLHAEWFVAFLFTEATGGDEALLAIEPDGARRFVVEGAELTEVVDLGTRAITFAGAPATLYAVRGRSSELGGEPREMTAARVRLRGGILFGAVIVRPGAPDADALRSMLEMVRPR